MHGTERGADYWDDEDLRLRLGHRGSTVVGPVKWQQFTLKLRQDSCTQIARFDYELGLAVHDSLDAVSRILARTFREQNRFERVAAAQCAKRMLEFADARRLSSAVRALGVFACLIQGIRLEVCHCAEADQDPRAARATIAGDLPDLSPGRKTG